MQNRRAFIKTGLLGSTMLAATSSVFAKDKEETILTILHTNDVHSHIEPFADDDKKYPGLGGAATRATIIKNMHTTHENILLLDAGDIFQGTPYFNFFHGDLEIDLMNSYIEIAHTAYNTVDTSYFLNWYFID